MACSQCASLKTLVDICATDHVHCCIDFLITAVDGALHPRVFPRSSESRGVSLVTFLRCVCVNFKLLRRTLQLREALPATAKCMQAVQDGLMLVLMKVRVCMFR
jgi:hypothetical protein